MATTQDPWGQTPLTAEGLAGQPLSLRDFNQDAGGYWRIIRGQKTYYPREWFDAAGTYTGSGTQAGDRAGQDQGFFHTGMRWNWTTGQWENPINKANVIGVAAAGGVGAGIAAPLIGAALGGGAGVGVGETGAVTGLGGSGFGTGAGLGYTAVAPSVGEALGIGAGDAAEAALTSEALAVGAYPAATVSAADAATAGLPVSLSVPNAAALPSGAASGGVSSALAGGGGIPWGQILGTGGSMNGAYGWLGPVVQASLGLIGTEKAVNANEAAAQKQLEATKYAADAQAKAAAESLAFQRQQAAYDATSAESTRSANYDQWAAKQQQLGSVGQALGLPARAIPAYVPLPPSGLGAPPSAPPTSAQQASATAFMPGAVANNPTAAQVPQTPGPGVATPAGADAAWWNAADPQGSVAKLFAGTPPTSQAILAKKAQIEAAGGQVSPANAEGVTSKIYLPGVGWTRVLDGGVAGGQGTGWTYVPQPGGGATPGRQGQPAYAMTDPLGSVQQYFLDPRLAGGQLKLPTGQLGSVGSYF